MELRNIQPKPLILLFKTPLGFYFYETNRNEVVSVNEQLYKYIDAVMKNDVQEMQQTEDEVVQQYHDLMDCEYLRSNRVKQIQHTATDNLELF